MLGPPAKDAGILSSSLTPPPPLRLREVVCEGGFWFLVLAGVFFHHRVLFFSETFYYRDLYLYYLPQKQYLVDLVRQGELPLWNPLLHGGMPFLGDLNQHLLYPPNLLYFLLPAPRAMSLLIAGHTVASSLAVYLLARVLGWRAPAAVVAGVVYAYCGPALSNTNLMIRLFGAFWIPVLVLFWHRYLRGGRHRDFLLTIAAGLLQLLSGAPEMIAMGLLTALGWGLADPESRFSMRRRLALWLLATAAVAGLAAVQLVPTAELASLSERGRGMGLGSFSSFSIYPQRMPELIVPEFLGRTDTITDFWGGAVTDGMFPYMLSLYLGAVPLLLALAGALRRRDPLPRRLRLYLAAVLVLGTVAVLGRFLPGFAWIYELFPPIRIFRFPVKVMSLVPLPLALLAAAGSEGLYAAGERRLVRRFLLAAGVAGLPLLAALGALASPASGEQLERALFGVSSATVTAGLRSGLFHALGVLLLAVLTSLVARRHRHPGWAWWMAAVVMLDLSLAGRRVNPSAPIEVLTVEPPVVARVREVVGEDGRFFRAPRPERILLHPPADDAVWIYRWNQEVLNFYAGTAYGFPMVFHEDFNGLAPLRMTNLKKALDALPWDRRLPIFSMASVRAILTHEELHLDGVEHVAAIRNASGIPFHLYRNQRAAERAQLVYVWLPVGSEREAVRAVAAPGFDPRQHVVLERTATAPPVTAQPRPECEGGLLERRHRSGRGSLFRLSTPCTAALVLSEPLYPGWVARLDGEPVGVYRANSAFSAVMIPAGEHEVEWRYEPRSVGLGALLSLLTLTALVSGTAYVARRRRSP